MNDLPSHCGRVSATHLAYNQTAMAHVRNELRDQPRLAAADESHLVATVQQLRGRTERDSLGLVPTPLGVAEGLYAVLESCFPLELARTVAVLDPAAGTGRLLTPAGARGKRAIAWEVDPVVADIGKHQLPSARWVVGDALRQTRPKVPHGQLSVVCNPPYVAGFARGSQLREMAADSVRAASVGWAKSAVSTVVAFIAHTLDNVLVGGEVAAFIVPDAVLNAERYRLTRMRVLELCDSLIVWRLPADTFPDHNVRTVVLVARKGGASSGVKRSNEVIGTAASPAESVNQKLERVQFVDVQSGRQSVCVSPTGHVERWAIELTPMFAIPWPSSDLEMVRRACGGNWPRLGEIAQIRDGINPGSRAARDALISQSPRSLVGARPCVTGTEVCAMRLQTPRSHLDYRTAAVSAAWRKSGTSLRRPGLFDGPRIYSRQTTATITAAYADDDSVAINSVHVIRINSDDPVALRRLCAVLNTPLMTRIYQALFAEDRRMFPQLKIANLRTLPVPWPLTDAEAQLADRCATDRDVDGALLELDARLQARLTA